MGKEISITLAELGYDIILNYNDSGKSALEETISSINKTGVNVSAIKCDVSDVSEIRKMFRAVSIKYKNLTCSLTMQRSSGILIFWKQLKRSLINL